MRRVASAMDVRVEELACHRRLTPVEGEPYRLSGGREYAAFTSTVVKVVADDGTCGYGEASTMGGDYLDGFLEGTEAGVRALAPLVLASNPLEPGSLVRSMDRCLKGQHPAKAAIDIAMWDLRGRLLGVPVGVLLGGVAQSALPAFTAVPLASAETMAETTERLCRRGYRVLQIKVGEDPLVDARRVHAVTEVMGAQSRCLSCDANASWTTAEALRFARAIDGIDTSLEQPCASLEELARVRSSCGMPVILDEGLASPRDLLTGLTMGCIDAVNIKSVRLGGLTRAAQVRDIAHAARCSMTIDEPMGGDLAAAAVVQLGSTIEPELLSAVSFFEEPSRREGTGVEFRDGYLQVPRGPGLGVEPDLEALGEPQFVLSARRHDSARTSGRTRSPAPGGAD